MAYTKIHSIKTTLTKALDYIENPEKTEDQLLVSGYNVDPLSASVEFAITRAMAKNTLGDRGKKKDGENLAYHLIQSFSPWDNVTPEQAHELGRRLANELLEGKFEYVISTHVDCGHIHNHIIFNATSFYNLRKFRSKPFQAANKIRSISDRICAEADLSVIRTPWQLGRSYRYKTPKGPSWKGQIRRWLQFVLQVAESVDELIDGAARLGVTVDVSGKSVRYQMDGQQYTTHDLALDKEGGFTLQGLEAQIEANTQLRERLKQDIQEAAAVATNCKDFQAEMQRRGVTVKQTRRNGMQYKMDGESLVREWTLGPGYTTEELQAVLERREDPERVFVRFGDPLDRLEEEFSRVSRDRSAEVGVAVSREQVLKTTSEGILVSVPGGPDNSAQLVFIDHNHVTWHRETDSFTAYVGNGYDYYVATADGEHTGSRIKGENIIRALELANRVECVPIEISAADIKAMSPKGLTVSLPELGVESLFIPAQFVSTDSAHGGSVQASIYEHWSYSFQRTDGATGYVSGTDLIGKLGQRQQDGNNSLLGRLNALRRRELLAETKQLTSALLLIRQEGIEDAAGFDARLKELAQKQASVQDSIGKLQARTAAYQKVARYLVTWHEYQPVKLQAMQLSGKAQRSFERTHEAELSAWSYADRQLEQMGVRPELEPEKVLALVKEQEREENELKVQADRLADQTAALEAARQELERVQQEGRRTQERPKEQEL